MSDRIVTAAVIIIGDEIPSGRKTVYCEHPASSLYSRRTPAACFMT